MTFTRLDDGIFEHPKMLRAGEDAAALYVRALVYCNRYLTDGHIPLEALSVITRRRDARALVARLVDANLLETNPQGGWIVHDFHDFNPRSEDVKARRAELSAKRAEAGKRGGIRSGESRRDEANAKQTRSKREANGEANAKPQSQSQSQSQSEEKTDRHVEPPAKEHGSSAGADSSKAATEEQRKRKSDGDESTPPDVRRVFDHWRAETNHPKARLDAKRAALIRRRLGEYSSDDLMRAIDGYASSPWHRGENDRGIAYDGIDLILRDSTHIERGWEMADKRPASSQPVDPWVAAAARQGVIL